MLCLVCEKTIPLDRQQAGSPFCSKEHGEQHGAQQPTRRRMSRLGLVPATFAPSSPACALLDAQPVTTASRTLLPPFCDVILGRTKLKPPEAIALPRARVVGGLPGAAPPVNGQAIRAGRPEQSNHLHLGPGLASRTAAARRLSTAPRALTAPAAASLPQTILCAVDGGFWIAPWDASILKRWPGARWASFSPAQPSLPVLIARNVLSATAAALAAVLPPQQIMRPVSREFASARVRFRPAGVFAETLRAADFRPALSAVDGGFWIAPWDASILKRWPGARWASFSPAQPSLPVLIARNVLSATDAALAHVPPPQQIMRPVSREFASARLRFRPAGVFVETLLKADFRPAPSVVEFRTGPLTIVLHGSSSLKPAGETFIRQAAFPASVTAAPVNVLPGFQAIRVADFPPAPLTSVLDCTLPPSALKRAAYRGGSFPPADSESQVASSPQAASKAAAVRLPKPLFSVQFGVEAAGDPQALEAIAESLPMADMAPAPHNLEALAPRPRLWLPEQVSGALTPSLRSSGAQVPNLCWVVQSPSPLTLEPAPFQYIHFIPRELGNPDVSDCESQSDESLVSTAGFADVSPWPLLGVFRALYNTADFSLCPASLEVLTLSRSRAVPRRGKYIVGAMGVPATFHDSSVLSEGPGFSGILVLPVVGAPEWEFGQKPAAIQSDKAGELSSSKKQSRNAPRLWRSVPVFVRGLALAIPLIAPAIYYAPSMITPASQAQMTAAMQARATIDLREDFQTGLGAWTGPQGWESSWSIDSPGAAQAGRLALFQAMTPLTDYHLELQGDIQAKALSFVFRAADMNNYHAAKIVIRNPGPLPSVYLVRYAVIAGRPGPKTETLLPMYLRTDSLYDVRVGIQGDNFTITINGQLVETWSDGRLKSGGVGLFAEKGELSHVRSIHVTENVDFLGWVCSQVSHWNADRPRIGVKHE
jgi:hypothetical protein